MRFVRGISAVRFSCVKWLFLQAFWLTVVRSGLRTEKLRTFTAVRIEWKILVEKFKNRTNVPNNPASYNFKLTMAKKKIPANYTEGRSWYILVFSDNSAHIMGPKGYYNVRESSQLIATLNQINSAHSIPSYLFQINFNIIFPSTTRSSKWSLHVSQPNPSVMYRPPPHLVLYSVARIIFGDCTTIMQVLIMTF